MPLKKKSVFSKNVTSAIDELADYIARDVDEALLDLDRDGKANEIAKEFWSETNSLDSSYTDGIVEIFDDGKNYNALTAAITKMVAERTADGIRDFVEVVIDSVRADLDEDLSSTKSTGRKVSLGTSLKILDKLRKFLRSYGYAGFDRLEYAEDPLVPGTLAVRASFADEDINPPFDLLVRMDEGYIDEVEFKSWPPTSRDF